MLTGGLVDSSDVRYDSVFTRGDGASRRRVQVVPILSKRQKGVLVAVSF